MATDRNFLDSIKDKGIRTVETLQRRFGIDFKDNRTWPQTRPPDSKLKLLNPNHRTKGFLPPSQIPVNDIKSLRISASKKVESGEEVIEDIELKGVEGLNVEGINYKYKDWRGHLLDPQINEYSLNSNNQDSPETSSTRSKFDATNSIPKSEDSLNTSPYSISDIYKIFGDTTNYFRHGLQIIDNINTPLKNDLSNVSSKNDSSFISQTTPYEQNDPVMFGFDIIIDDVTSPLLNGSVLDFLRNYNNVSEISSRIPVYEDFKQQFIKFFKTKSTVSINPETTTISKMREASTPEAPSRENFFQDMNKKAYMNYYLKKVAGLEKLIEQNIPSTKKFLVEYNKDIISLSFSEDVTLSVGTMAHLYKLLYWSKPNGKGIVPENLLRFNCDIIVSEVRNYKRVIKSLDKIDSENQDSDKYVEKIKIIKDNVSRYVYSLRECQFYFNTLPHGPDVDMGVTNMSAYPEGGYTIQFDYKYSTVKLERFVPKLDGSGEGQYVGYDGGAMWRIGTPGARESRQISDNDPSIDTSKFFTKGENKFNQNGVNIPFVLEIPKISSLDRDSPVNFETNEQTSFFTRFKESQIQKAKIAGKRVLNNTIASVQRELQTAVNIRVALLNKTLNRIIESQVDISRVSPPRNIYTDSNLKSKGKIFYDVRGELLNFLGSSFGTQIPGSNQTIVT